MSITPGYYKARAIEGSERFGRAKSGGEQVAFDLEIEEGTYAGERVTTVLSFSGGAKKISFERLCKCGWSYGDTLAGISKNVVDLEAREETYNGETRLRFEIKTYGHFEFKEKLDDKEKRAFMKELQTFAKQMESKPSGGSPNEQKSYPKDWDEPQGKPAVNL